MGLTFDRILDRLWLVLAGAAALALALHGGAQLGLRGWSSGAPVQTAQAAAPAAPTRTDRHGAGCRDAGADPAR